MEQEEIHHPVPAPRRLYPELRKYEYENVSIDAINKTLKISFDNIHINNNFSDKIPKNKSFLEGLKENQNNSHDKTDVNCNMKPTILTQTNDIYGPNANETVDTSEFPLYSTPKPAPRPRKTQNNNVSSVNNDIYENVTFPLNNLSESSKATGAVAKESATLPHRRAPELPPKTYLTADRKKDRSERNSITSEISTTSSCIGEASYTLGESTFYNTKVAKSASNNTLNSSIADSTEGSDSSKYKSPSPGYVTSDSSNIKDFDDEIKKINNDLDHVRAVIDSNLRDNISSDDYDSASSDELESTTQLNKDIFKSLGATSKLLSESIGERVALRAKGAKHKLDKNLKYSGQLLSSYSTEASKSLKKVSKRFGTNFSTIKKEKNTEKMSYDLERPQTMPANDQVFKSISFTSPLNKKTGGITDLRNALAEEEEESDPDGTYEVPKNSNKKANNSNMNLQPPPYEEALRGSTPSPVAKNSHISANEIHSKDSKDFLEKDPTNKKNPLLKTKKTDLQNLTSSSDNSSLDIPMPNYPPPELPKDKPSSAEAVYGKLNPIQAPLRQKRKKNYEEIQLRRNQIASQNSDKASVRPAVDSAELAELNKTALALEREDSVHLREEILKAESSTPKPDRSDSWQYYEDEANGSDSSSPEPIYANHEATYGRVFHITTSNQDIMQAECNLVDISEEETESEEGASGGGWVKPPKDIIKEFDPLESRNSTLLRSDKSNELLLLEHLLEDEVYGVVKVGKDKIDDDIISSCTSEEDNLNISHTVKTKDCNQVSSEVQQTVLLPSPNSSNTSEQPSLAAKKLSIVHQNAQLLSESMENMLDDPKEAAIKPYLSRIDENVPSTSNADLSHPNQNRSQWFVSEGKENSPKRVNPFNKMNIQGDESPPSYLEAIGENEKPSFAPNEQKTFSQRFMNPKNVFNNVMHRVDALKRKSSFKASLRNSDVKVAIQMIPKPTLSPLLVRHEGLLIRFPSGVVEDILKEIQNRKAILRDRQFQTFQDVEMKTAKETIPLEHITTVQCVSNSRVTDNATHFYCFEITSSAAKNNNSSSPTSLHHLSNPNLVMTSGSSGNCKQQRNTQLYGVSKESERDIWMQKLLESLTNNVPAKYTCHYYRAGWCYLKNSITSEWNGTWLVLKKSQRRLIFVSEATLNVEKMDLRKARCIVLKEGDDSIKNLHVESGPILMIDCPPFTVYMVMASPRETKTWRHIIREVAHNNGFALHDQQLTKYNVPVIVDKCINFVYIHGSMSEGIYRKSGSENNILKLISAFRADAFNVEITRNEYNEHDVANVLKRFMRELPERLIGKQAECFTCVQGLDKSSDKIAFYKELIGRLSVVERETLKKIVGHLAFISSLRSKNKMSIQNLTMIWGPTLLKSVPCEEMVYNQKEADVLADLIVLYKNLFPFTADEIKKEQEMLMCLQKYYAAAETLTDSVKKSGDLKMWITIDPRPENDKEEKDQVNVTISPTKTVSEVCKELASKMGMASHLISLHEVILNDTLERPLHHEMKVFDVVLNWSYWPEDDRKNNYLVVKPIDFLREVQRAVKNLATVTPGKELRFVDNRTKSWKSFQCELRDNKIVISKKEKNDKTTIIREIFLQSCTAYLGCEKKRDFPWSWAITFIEKTQTQIMRSRDSPFIGHVLAGSEWVDRTIWFSSIWYCLFGDNILPPAEIIIK